MLTKSCKNFDELKPSYMGQYKVKARLSRLWVAMSVTSKDVFGLEMVLIDEKDNAIHASIPKRFMEKFEGNLEEGKLYHFENFDVTDRQRDYRPVDYGLKIFFKENTKVDEALQDESIPNHKFMFVDYDKLNQRFTNKTFLTDIIGILHVVRETTDVNVYGKMTKCREIELMNNKSETLTVTLWGDLIDQITKDTMKESRLDVVIIITSTNVKLFKGRFTPQTLPATKIYINLDSKYVDEFRSSSTNIPVSVSFENGPNKQRLSLKAQLQEKSTTISALIGKGINGSEQGNSYICKATITRVYGRTWYYVSCGFCNKSVKDGRTCCQNQEKTRNLVPRFKYRVRVDDDTGSTTFVAFGKHAQILLQHPVDHLIEMEEKENGARVVQNILEKTVGGQHIFEVTISNFSRDENYQSFTINNILPINNDPDIGNSSDTLQKEFSKHNGDKGIDNPGDNHMSKRQRKEIDYQV